jgi:hypothetical protein
MAAGIAFTDLLRRDALDGEEMSRRSREPPRSSGMRTASNRFMSPTAFFCNRNFSILLQYKYFPHFHLVD